ncbi:homocitrate synthase/isopropylmalate synthase family protein, partial [Virgibacillus salexigens]|uniref:homocitrate synthase/isopropylmalate synthase family protein n=1 Tax=Virgibacillus salexigens TaxID=61016 RepID=UPI003F68EFAE
LFLGKHSGRHAFKDKVEELGMDVSVDNIKKAFELFKQLTDHKKEVTDDDIFTIVTEVQTDATSIEKYQLKMFQLQYGSNNIPTAAIELTTPSGNTVKTA